MGIRSVNALFMRRVWLKYYIPSRSHAYICKIIIILYNQVIKYYRRS